MKKLKFFLILILLFFISKAYSAQNNEHTLENYDENLQFCKNKKGKKFTSYILLNDINNLSLEINNNRSWYKNAFKSVIHRNINIPKKYKKKFKGKLIVNLLDGSECEFKVTVRIHGDVKDHIEMQDGKIYSSLNVRLNEGNINSIIKFILFLPKTRNGDNEIFTSVLYKNLGFISPRTRYLNVKFNGEIKKFIFQEKITKELLEHNKLTEGPIIEASQRFVWPEKVNQYLDVRFVQGRMINEVWSTKNEETFKLSLIALSKFNQVISQDRDLFNLVDMNYEDQKFHKKFFTYDAILTSMNAFHGLGPRDRKFYFDPINFLFKPIYYDGNATLIGSFSKTDYNNETISIFSKLGADNAAELLDNLNIQNLKQDLINSGFNINTRNLKNLVDKMKKNLINIKNLNLPKKKFQVKKAYFLKFHPNAIDKRLVFYKKNILDKINTFLICDFKLNNCKDEILNNKEIHELVSGRLKKNELYYIFISNNIDDYKRGNLNKDIVEIKDRFKTININNSSLIVSKGLDTLVDHTNKIITLKQSKSDDVAIFKNGNVEGWKIVFSGTKRLPDKNYNFYFNGCLIFYKTILQNVEIEIDNVNCEDGVNLINSSGKIDKLKIINSFSDAIDMDFSNIYVKNLFVDTALNDCLDLSYGNYSFENLQLHNCGDKGLSIGEKSELKSKKIFIENSNLGFVVKDSSKAIIEYLNINHIKTCLSAYNKKQMFFGGLANIENINCTNYILKSDVDHISKILFKKWN